MAALDGAEPEEAPIAGARPLPPWSEELKRRYLGGEASLFVLHGNVNDLIQSDGRFVRFSDFLSQVLLGPSKDVVLHYDVATGATFAKKPAQMGVPSELKAEAPERVLAAIEGLLQQQDKLAVIIDYAEMLAPAGEANFASAADRQSVVTLHRWSFSPALERADNVVLLVTENLSELHPKIVSSPTAAIIHVPMPGELERYQAIRALAPEHDEPWAHTLSRVTAGLKLVQLRAVLSAESSELDARRDEADSGRERLLRAIFAHKRAIIERECFGLIEFVEPSHDFSVVGGSDEMKRELCAIADNVRQGRTSRCPMGLLFTGPMGTGKTFVAEAFVKQTGLTAIKLKNFRSKWVGASEANLERILSVVKAMGQVIVLIDEGDRAFGSEDGEADGGTSSRVMARLKEFMSDTSNRGKVLFILMTNRPDKLDIDIKRAGRLDRKIPFLFPQEANEVAAILLAQLRKHGLGTTLSTEQWRDQVGSNLVGYSHAELEAVLLLAHEYAGDLPLAASHIADAMRDYLPSRDDEMLAYMELIAVFEASNRRMLPKKYADVPANELQARLLTLRASVGSRR
jgi:transitional endoplasmic reticulum ATPase